MNFKNFLTNNKQLQESHFLEEPKKVILGYGTFGPFHIGYQPMFTEMLKLSEELGADAVLTIIRTPELTETMLASTIATLQADFPFLNVVVERDMSQALMKMHSYGHAPVKLLGEAVMVDKALAACKAIFGQDHNVQVATGYLEGIQSICEEAVANDDLYTFQSYVHNTGNTVTIFEQLKETYGRQ